LPSSGLEKVQLVGFDTNVPASASPTDVDDADLTIGNVTFQG
jgi:hypothetical protein